jgi:hypothetical protein
MASLTTKRKIVLALILLIVVAGHVALFVAGGSYKTLAEVLLVVDVVSAFFIVGAVREFKKLDEKKES